jgi:hypothetical protein
MLTRDFDNHVSHNYKNCESAQWQGEVLQVPGYVFESQSCNFCSNHCTNKLFAHQISKIVNRNAKCHATPNKSNQAPPLLKKLKFVVLC